MSTYRTRWNALEEAYDAALPKEQKGILAQVPYVNLAVLEAGLTKTSRIIALLEECGDMPKTVLVKRIACKGMTATFLSGMTKAELLCTLIRKEA